MSQLGRRVLGRGAWIIPAALFGPALGDGREERAPGPPVEATGHAPPRLEPRAGSVQWSVGEPTDDEQELLELMNRARMNPRDEGDRVFADYGSPRITSAVDFFLQERPGVEWTRAENRAAFLGYPARPPLAFSSKLIDAARAHSVLLRQHDQQSHQVMEAGEPSLFTRVTNAGYAASSVAESVFSYAETMLHAHAGFAIDWGQGVPIGETRPSLGHRLNLMGFDLSPNRDYREVGVGVIEDSNASTDVGPRVVTIDFAKPSGSPQYFVTGVCYDDLDRDGAWDPGEGLTGVRIDVEGSEHFAISTATGAYAVPIPATGTIHVTAAGQPATPSAVVGNQSVFVQVNSANVKLDFTREPEPALPSFVEASSTSALLLSDNGTVQTTLGIPVPGELADVAGDVEVALDLTHAERSELKITLLAPDGTSVVLFDHAPGGAGLTGVFDTSLAPREPLAALNGKQLSGTWRLAIEDSVPGNQGTLNSWTLKVRPQWVRTLHCAATPLFVTKLKVKDVPESLADSLTFKAEVDTGSVLLDPSRPCELRLTTDDALRAELLRVTIPPAAVSYRIDGTSRTLVSAKVTGFDLPAALPATARVELAVGGAIVEETVPVRKSAFTGATTKPVSGLFRVDAIATKVSLGTALVTVRGRIVTPGTPYGTGTLEVSLGDLRFRNAVSSMTGLGAKRTFKSGSTLRKLVVDSAKGTFSMVVATTTDVLAASALEVTLRLGDDGFFGTTTVVPRENGLSLTY